MNSYPLQLLMLEKKKSSSTSKEDFNLSSLKPKDSLLKFQLPITGLVVIGFVNSTKPKVIH